MVHRLHVLIPFCGVTLYHVIKQSMISICGMKKILGGEAKQTPLDST
jgi:hypothetical protein